MRDLLLIVFNTVLVNNLVLNHLIGVDVQFTASNRLDISWFTGLFTLCCLCILLPFVYCLQIMVITPLRIEYLELLLCVLSAIVVFLILKKLLQNWFRLEFYKNNAIAYVTLINTILFAVVLLKSLTTNSFLELFSSGLMSGITFLFLLLAITCLRDRINYNCVPWPFRGLPIVLITYGLLSIGFMGLSNLS